MRSLCVCLCYVSRYQRPLAEFEWLPAAVSCLPRFESKE